MTAAAAGPTAAAGAALVAPATPSSPATNIFFWIRVVIGSLFAPIKDGDNARHEHARDEQL